MTEPLALRDEREETYTGEDLPAQGGGFVPTIFPGRDFFRLPANLDQCWEAKDYEKKDRDGNVIPDPADPTKPQVEQHLLLRMDQENPMVVVGGDYDGLPATATVTTIARRRGKKTDKDAPMVHDLTYLVRTSLADKTPVSLKKEWPAVVNRHAGAIVFLEHGLSANCDPERTRYIDDGTGSGIEDPDGIKGCGKANGKEHGRLYSNDFKVSRFQDDRTGSVYNTREEALEAEVPAANIKVVQVFVDTVYCKGCGARLRGFFRVEKFLPPPASTQTVQG